MSTNLKLAESGRFLESAREHIPCQAQTFSKSPEYFPPQYPYALDKGEGSHVWDVDGNEYIDWIAGLGAVTLGYRNLEVDAAIKRQLSSGISFSLPHRLEVRLAELLSETIPCAEMSRFSKTGSEVCQAAVRLARAYTNRDVVLSWGYHGWHEEMVVHTDKTRGIPLAHRTLLKEFQYNDLAGLENLFREYTGRVAAVFMEPVTFTPPMPDYLQGVVDLAHKQGALVIFDEMVTGFRWRVGGAQEYFGVVPDLATFGKGIANGMPLAVLCGRREIMRELENGVFFSTTFGGEALSIAAAIATILTMRKTDYVTRIWNLGVKLTTALEGLYGLGVTTAGYSCRPLIMVRDEEGEETPEWRSLFMQEMVARGVMAHSGGWNMMPAHTHEDIGGTVEAAGEVLTEMRAGRVRLEGRPAKMSFRRV